MGKEEVEERRTDAKTSGFAWYAVGAGVAALVALGWGRTTALSTFEWWSAFSDAYILLFIQLVFPAVLGLTVVLQAVRIGTRGEQAKPAVWSVVALASFYGAALLLGVYYWVSWWPGRVGMYAIPHLPDPVGTFVGPTLTELLGTGICGAGVILLVLSVRRGEKARPLLILTVLILLVTITEAFVYDAVTRSPYWVVRKLARAARRYDQQAMNRYLSAESLSKYRKNPNARSYYEAGRRKYLGWFMGAETARRTLLLDLHMQNGRAEMETVVPWRWTMSGFSGHGGRVYLVKEQGHWKIDLVRARREHRERFGLDELE